MARNYKISVAMATYNGEKYIKQQIESILSQLDIDDELIISDDGSFDDTLSIIRSFNDNRITVIDGPKKGVKQNFANAISHCTGKYIFLSDQDDIWENSKVKVVLHVFENSNCNCVVHDCSAFDSETNDIIIDSFFDYRKSGKGIIKNILKNTYIGCCMAFNSEIISKILPIPDDIEMHDQWIGIICEKNGESLFIKDKLIKYRRHNSNVTKLKPHSLYKRLKNRVILIWRLIYG